MKFPAYLSIIVGLFWGYRTTDYMGNGTMISLALVMLGMMGLWVEDALKAIRKRLDTLEQRNDDVDRLVIPAEAKP